MPEITVIAHNIRSAHNIGSIFRTCEGFGVKKIIISGYTPYPTIPDDPRLPHIRDKITHQIHKTALGAEAMVHFEQYDDLEQWLSTNNLPVIALEQSHHSVILKDFQPPDAFAILLGEEVLGIEDSLLSKCEATVEIPMKGKKESFNVSVAAGIAIYSLSDK